MKTTPAARYDLAALRPPEPGTGTGTGINVQDTVTVQTLQTLQRWCLAGSGPGGSLWWRPNAQPAVQTRLALAHLHHHTAPTSGNGLPQRIAAQLMLERDGSLRLQACRTGAGRLALRLKTKAHDLMWWHRRQPGDAWDSGYVRGTAAALQALARFQPRRATLLVADGLNDAALVALWLDLQARQRSFAHPVRLLVLGPLPAAMVAGWAAPLAADGAITSVASSAQ